MPAPREEVPPSPATIQQKHTPKLLFSPSSRQQSFVAGTRHYDIAFTNLTFDVLDRASKKEKRILNDVSGLASAGRLLAIMGASGAGKTTLVRVCGGGVGACVQGACAIYAIECMPQGSPPLVQALRLRPSLAVWPWHAA